MACAPSGGCCVLGEEATVEHQDGEFDEDYGGGPEEFEGVLALREY